MQVNENVKKSSPEGLDELGGELKDWEEELKRLQELAKIAEKRTTAQSEIPALEKQIKEHEERYAALTEKAEEVRLGAALLDTS